MGSQFSVKAVCRHAGLTPDTLRAWERRYGAVTPQRDGSGRRVYTEAEANRLLALKNATQRGHAIRLVAKLSDEELSRLSEAPTEPQLADFQAIAPSLSDPNYFVQNAMACIERYDFNGFEAELHRAARLLPPLELLYDVIMPVLDCTGNAWAAGTLSIAQEHAASASLRHLMGTLIRTYPPGEGAARVIFATPSSEPHEFGILMAALLAARRGVAMQYLGASVPAAQIAEAAHAMRCQVVALSVVSERELEDKAAQVRELSDLLDPTISIWLGGANARVAYTRLEPGRGLLLRDLQDFHIRLGLLA